MSRYRKGIDSKEIEKRLAEGRGQGEGAYYNPWHHIQDFPSKGRVHRIKGWLHGRVHHLFSDLELYIFLTYLWSRDTIIDIREQYPLLPLEETLNIAQELGIRHPTDPRTKYPTVLTTDFFLTIRSKLTTTYVPRTVKYLADLSLSRTLEKLEIERLYWERRVKSWGVVTEEDLPMALIQNVAWVLPFYRLIDLYPMVESTINEIATVLTSRTFGSNSSLGNVCGDCDSQLRLRRGTSLKVVRHLVATGFWRVDMKFPLHSRERFRLLDAPEGNPYPSRLVA